MASLRTKLEAKKIKINKIFNIISQIFSYTIPIFLDCFLFLLFANFSFPLSILGGNVVHNFPGFIIPKKTRKNKKIKNIK